MQELTLKLINRRLDEARSKFPLFAPYGKYQAVSVIGEEYGEFAQAVNDGRMADAVNEALDTIATSVRFIEEVAICETIVTVEEKTFLSNAGLIVIKGGLGDEKI